VTPNEDSSELLPKQTTHETPPVLALFRGSKPARPTAGPPNSTKARGRGISRRSRNSLKNYRLNSIQSWNCSSPRSSKKNY